jgi:hypothetical protein
MQPLLYDKTLLTSKTGEAMYPNQWAHRGPMVFFNIIANRQIDFFRTMIFHNIFLLNYTIDMNLVSRK